MTAKSRIKSRALTRRASKNREYASAAIRSHLDKKKSKILRPKQIPIVFSVAKKFEEGSNGVYLDLPTGIGKTVITTQIIDALRKDGRHPKVLIVTYSKELVKQTKGSFEEHASDIPVGLYYQHEKDIDQDVTVTTYASFPYFAKNFAEQYDYVIFDESHKLLSDERLKLAQNFKNANFIALTASPAYSTDKTLEDHFDLAYKMSVPEAIDNDLICGYRNILVETDLADLDNVKLSSNGDYEKQSLARAIDTYSRNKAAVEFYRDELDPETGRSLLGKRGIINCVDINHAENVAELFNEHIKSETVDGKIPCAAIHSKMPKAEREKILQDHKAGKILLLANADILIEGYDDPTIELCLNLAPSRSLVRVSQRAGRALRIDKNNPHKAALIVDFMDRVSIEKQKGLTYGDIVGGAAYSSPSVMGPRINGPSPGGGTPIHIDVDQEFLKKLKVIWSSQEVDARIKQNQFIREKGEILLNKKKDDEASSEDMAQEGNVSVTLVNKHIKKLIELEGKKGEYIYSEDTSKEPKIYHGRKVKNNNAFYLEKKDVPYFLQNCVLKNIPKKQYDILTVSDVAKEFQADYEGVKKIFDRFKPIEGKEGLYFDPLDKNKENPNEFNLVITKDSNNIEKRHLKRSDLENFGKIYFPLSKKQKDELSYVDIAKRLKAKKDNIAMIINRLQPVEGEEDLYFDPESENKDKPNTFTIVIRRNQKSDKGIRCIKEYELEKLRLAYFSHRGKKKNNEISNKDIMKENRKKEDEFSANDMGKQEGVDHKTIRPELNKLIPFKDKPGQYIHPDDTSKKPFIYYGAERISQKGQPMRVLKKDSVRPFMDNIILKDRKKKDELSAVDFSKILVISDATASTLFKNYKLLKKNSNTYIHPSEKFTETIEMVTRNSPKGSIFCLKENSVDIVAQQNNLEYRDPVMKKKYQKLAKQQPE